MTKKQNEARTKQNQAELNALELEFLSQVSGAAKSGKNPRDPNGFTTYIHPRTKVVTKIVRVWNGRPPR
jgi:hypothetical protein